MSFDRFLWAVESRNLSQDDKSIIRVSSFSILQKMNDKIYSLQFAVHGLQSKEEFLISTPTSLLGMYCIGSFH